MVSHILSKIIQFKKFKLVWVLIRTNFMSADVCQILILFFTIRYSYAIDNVLL